jgi:PPOX class probable F420-dependent enzyme
MRAMRSLPATHVDLLDSPLPTVLTTEMPDGRLQSTVVWCNREGDTVLLNTMREFQKARNLANRPRATVTVLDPDGERWIEIRGRAELRNDGALEHLDALSRLYTGTAPYFGEVIDAAYAEREHPVQVRLVPVAIATNRPSTATGARTARPLPEHWGERRPCDADVEIPDAHRALLQRPIVATLATRLPSGGAQTQPVWFTLDGRDLLVSTTRERRKGRNLESDPRATLLVVDPDDDGHWIELRGDVDLSGDDGEATLDLLTRRYTAHDRFYGGVYPAERRATETRLVARLHPRRVTVDAVH